MNYATDVIQITNNQPLKFTAFTVFNFDGRLGMKCIFLSFHLDKLPKFNRQKQI